MIRLVQLSTTTMTSPIPHRRFPTAMVSNQQIVYVTDNDRDAEALSCEMESPVVSDLRNPSTRLGYSTIIIRQTSKTLGTSRRSNVSDVRKVFKTSSTTDSPNASDVSDSSNVQTFTL